MSPEERAIIAAANRAASELPVDQRPAAYNPDETFPQGLILPDGFKRETTPVDVVDHLNKLVETVPVDSNFRPNYYDPFYDLEDMFAPPPPKEKTAWQKIKSLFGSA